MLDEVDWNYIARYLAGECSGEDKERLESWIREDPRRKQLLDSLQELRRSRQPRSWDAQAAWHKLAPSLDEEAWPPRPRRPVAPRRDRRSRRRRPGRLAAAAAVALIACVIAFAFIQFSGLGLLETSEEPSMREIATERGERVRLTLADGTQVRLNANSTLTFPARFDSRTREVALSGEAYFETSYDEQRPFRVNAGHATVRVLGTSFNVRAYPTDDLLDVVVASGKVAVRADDAEAADEVMLTHAEMARLSRGGEITLYENVDLARAFGWIERRLVFEDTPFDEVIPTLERWYDLDIELADPAIGQRRLTASFDDESVSTILNVVALSLNLEYEAERRHITFYPLDNPRHPTN